MATYVYVLCAAGGLALGIAAAYVNSLLTRSSLGKDSVAAIMGTNAARFAIDMAVLGLCYLLCRCFELPAILTLVSAATGLSVFGLLFIRRITNEIKAQGNAGNERGGDDQCRNS